MNTFFDFVRGGGWVMYPLLLLSVGAVAVIIERLIAFRALAYLAPGLLASVTKLVKSGRLEEAQLQCDAERGPLAASLSTILRHRNRPVGVAERQVEEIGSDYFAKMERFLPFLDTVTTISPLLGLLGTIVGMIGTFNAIAVQQTRGNSDAVLSGVGEALYATATGITIAVVCFIAYNFFASKLRSTTSETELAATRLINVLTDEGFFTTDRLTANEVNGEVQSATRA
ncbi:MotA/TolQ/ExbB proton channel family protein [bacterium]|nr:MAG: MotA/TolQ/ExbB proton channel family protein [bacterium]